MIPTDLKQNVSLIENLEASVMTDIDKAVEILRSSNNGDDLPVHHRKIVAAALSGEWGEVTSSTRSSSRLPFMQFSRYA